MVQISCILPNYNDGEKIIRAIESISAQFTENDSYEIIIIDDKSTDDSLQIISKLTETNSYIQIYQNDRNRGPFATVTQGLQYAKGELIYLGSANDLIFPGFLSEAVSALKQYPQAAFFCANADVIRNEKRQKSDIGWGKKARYFSVQDILHETFGRIRSFHGQSVVMRRSFFPEKELNEKEDLYRKLGGMVDLFILAACALRHGFCYSPESFSEIVTNDQSFSAKLKNKLEKEKAIRSLIEMMKTTGYNDIREKMIQSGILSFIGLRFFLVLARDRHFDLLSKNLVREFFYLIADKTRAFVRKIK